MSVVQCALHATIGGGAIRSPSIEAAHEVSILASGKGAEDSLVAQAFVVAHTIDRLGNPSSDRRGASLSVEVNISPYTSLPIPQLRIRIRVGSHSGSGSA